MNLKRWIARREADWQHFDRLLQQAERRGIATLSAQQLRDLASLYRSVSGDLARARTQGLGQGLTADLQQLVTRGYHQIYQGARRQEWQAVGRFLSQGFPQILRQTWPFTGAATALFGGALLAGGWLAWRDPVFLELMLPQWLIEQVRDRQELWFGSIVGVEPLASTNIAINNLQVAAGALAGGITGGLYTIYILLLNGLLLGVVAVLVAQQGLAYPFWAFVFPHGALELPAIFLAGGAGLLIARALVCPGRYRRAEALKLYGGQAVQLMFGVTGLLAIAGAIEGFVSPNPAIPEALKYGIGTVLLALLLLYSLSPPPPATLLQQERAHDSL